ncbi:DUF6585 family protein [Streptomyces sp. G-G2]|uniref:DUF6585 family protein n=1 Tax=Streptomyces sp. G-G2 TaxID=3046201 RepID=UPI0024BAEBAB|nr:DUF6585 family protein [Streptomyces sp. G-G2]MDJ0385801.1 hypothetical protein [Streptomyces sp. G-G2]
MILPRSSEWAELTHEATEVATRYDLGDLQNSFPTKVGLRRKSVRRVYAFYAGMVWQDPGAETEAMRWSDVVDWRESRTLHYQPGTYSHTQFSYTLTRADNVSLTLTSTFRDRRMEHPPVNQVGPPQAFSCSEFCQLVCGHLAETMLPATLQAVQRGEPQDFGSITLSMDRIKVGRHDHPWAQVKNLGVREGSFEVSVGGLRRPLTQETAEIPRFTLSLIFNLAAVSGGRVR